MNEYLSSRIWRPLSAIAGPYKFLLPLVFWEISTLIFIVPAGVNNGDPFPWSPLVTSFLDGSHSDVEAFLKTQS